MKLKKLFLEDFRGIEHLNLDLDGKSAILYGINGAGKSSILSAVNLLYVNIINRIVKSRFKQSVNIEVTDIKKGKAFAKIGAEFMFELEGEEAEYCRCIYHDNRRENYGTLLDALVSIYEKCYIGEFRIDENNQLLVQKEKLNMPVFVNYGVNRLVLKTPLRIRKGPDYGPFAAFEKAIESKIAFEKLFEWFLEQELYETLMQKKDAAYVDPSLKSVKKAMLALFEGYEDIHIDARPYSMKITKDNEKLDILQLSDGEKCTLALFGDLARRLVLANASSDNPLEGLGVVLIDEIELHMHASWQRKIYRVLRETFPNIQFILTTHSAQVISEIDDDCQIFSLEREGNKITVQKMSSAYGLDSNSVLEDFFHTDSLNKEVKNLVEQMYGCIEEKNYDAAEKLADKIDEITKGRNVDTVKARIYIHKGRRKNAKN